jgi:hypothetical protein
MAGDLDTAPSEEDSYWQANLVAFDKSPNEDMFLPEFSELDDLAGDV